MTRERAQGKQSPLKPGSLNPLADKSNAHALSVQREISPHLSALWQAQVIALWIEKVCQYVPELPSTLYSSIDLYMGEKKNGLTHSNG